MEKYLNSTPYCEDKIHEMDKKWKSERITNDECQTITQDSHINSQENNAEQDSLQCHICTKTFKLKSSLVGYIKCHNRGKSAKCDIRKLCTSPFLVVNDHSDTVEKQDECNIGWTTLQKQRRLQGKEYISKKYIGNTLERVKRNAKHIGERCKHGAVTISDRSYLCGSVGDEKRQMLFNHFWTDLSDWDQKICYVRSLVTSRSVTRRRRQTEMKYEKLESFDITLENDNDIKVRVCKDFFLSTLCLGKSQFSHWTSRFPQCHKKVKQFKCEICKRRFNRMSALVKHERIHAGEKPFECEVCKECFTRSHDLVRHKQIHTGEKHFDCNICNKRISTSSHLDVHNHIHTAEKEDECDFGKKTIFKTYHVYKLIEEYMH